VRAASLAVVEGLEDRRLLSAFTALINFQPPKTSVPAGYKADTGAVFGDRGNGLTYGWNAANNNALDRNSKRSPDQRYDTFAQMQVGGSFTWEIAVPNGTYDVRPVAGDPVSVDAFYHVLAEGKNVIFGRPSSPSQHWIGGNSPVVVSDGRLTISNGASAVNNKINFIEIRKAAPTRPSNLSATSVSPTQINLTWTDNANNEDGFILERNVTSNIWERVAVLGANVTSFLDTGLKADTRYTYQIRAFNDVGQSQNSTVAVATTPPIPGLAPAAPTELTAVSSGASFATITWKDNSDNEDVFIIQRIGYSGTFENWRQVGANTTSANVFLRSAQINTIRVVAKNSAGGSSDPSNVVSIATKPEAPISAGARAVSSSEIDVFWDSIDSCQFHVEKLVDGVWVRIASDVLSLSYRDTGLTPGTSYSYRVIAVAANEAGDSDPSDVVSATTAPAAVTGLAVTGVTASSVSLQWNDVTGEQFYQVERSLDGANWTVVTYLYADTTTYTNTGLASGTTYLFRVTGMAYGPVAGERGEVVSARTR
jgi:fibronectin type 3 domain-containing protein